MERKNLKKKWIEKDKTVKVVGQTYGKKKWIKRRKK